MRIQRLSILGVGLLGGSIGLAAKAGLNDVRIIGYGHRRATLDRALEVGAIDEAFDDPGEAVRQSDMVILCTPVGIFPDMLRAIAPALPPQALVTDVGSTKRSIVEQAQQFLPHPGRFVGSHPMAGSEKRGVEYARTDLFRKALCITTPVPQTEPAALEEIEAFWKCLGMRITRLSPAEHDQRLADVSHLPHVVAAALVAMQESAALELSGRGFLDTTRIAGGDGGLWRDILLDNRTNLRDGIQRLQAQLEHLLGLLERHDGEGIRQWLDNAATRREQLLQAKLKEIGDD